MSTPKPPTAYPSDHHLVHDLRIAIERDADRWQIRLPITPEILDASGRPRVGALAIIADMISGQTAIREVAPGWIATSNLGLQTSALPSSGSVVGRPKVLRKGATTIVIEVDLFHGETNEPLGLSTLGFAILPNRNERQAALHRARTEGAETMASPLGAGLTKPILEAMNVVFPPDDPATAEIAVDPYLQNTLGALQGGIVAVFVEATAERYASARLGGPVRVRGIEVQYLKLGKVGPVRARAREIGRLAGGLVVRVELFDRGQADALLTVATIWVEALGGRAPA